ncbi:MAG TPA: ribosome assembly cofactor RimP [Paludibacteraceae bacterium]|nr:ribosome assembly cofactor RimP [Paludibacteraceae bacterium]
MINKETVKQLVNEKIADTDYFLVDVVVSPSNAITVEIDTQDGVNVGFCAELSRHIESQLDREVEDYELEVGSAGLTSPFKVVEQYLKNIGNEVEVLTKDGKKISGVLTEVASETFTLEIEKMVKKEGAKRKVLENETLLINFDSVKYTKYIIKFK